MTLESAERLTKLLVSRHNSKPYKEDVEMARLVDGFIIRRIELF